MSARQPPPQLRRTVNTSVCQVTVEDGVAGRPGPAILCIRGVWAPVTYLLELFDHFPDTDMVIGDQPGMWLNPPVPSTSAQFSRAFDEVIEQLLPGRDVVALGVSTGALVTFGLTRPEVRSHVAVEPFLRTANLWPLVVNMRDRIAQFPHKQHLHDYVRDLFGYTKDSVVDQDFRPLAKALRTPVRAVYGGLPLDPPRTLPRWPSLSDEDTRATLAALPGARPALVAPPETGHDVTKEEAGMSLVLQALREALAELGGEASPSRA